MKHASKLAVLLLVFLLVLSMSIMVYGQTQVQVTIRDPYVPSNGALGNSADGYWVGEIPITVSGSSVPAQQTNSYCIDFDGTIYIGSTYDASVTTATDTAEWRAVGYLLTWYSPPTSNDAATSNQVAVWRLLNTTRGTNYVKPSWLSASYDAAGSVLADEAWGKDILRDGDVFQWVSPVTFNQSSVVANPGQTITFMAHLASSGGAPRANVRVVFTATLQPGNVVLSSTYVNPGVAFTDNNGDVAVNVEVPSDAAVGTSIEVKAHTYGVWAQQYLDLTNPNAQDLIATDTAFSLTLSSSVSITTYLFVVPESSLGALTVLVACFGSFGVWRVYGRTNTYSSNSS